MCRKEGSSSALRKSPAEAKRSAGSFSRARWDRGTAQRDPRRGAGQDTGQHGLRAGPGEGGLTDEHLVEHATERVHVAPGIQGAIPGGLFRAHVVRRPEAQPRLGDAAVPGPGDGQRDAEVRDEWLPARHQHVRRLDVAVHHAPLVRIVQRGGELARDVERRIDRELPLPGQPLPQRLALDVGHHVVEEAFGLARIVQREDVRVLELRRGLDLGEEALLAHHGRELGPEHLDRHPAVVLQVIGEVDGGHAALAELPLDAVAVG